MNILEIEGKTIDEAIQNACNEFNAPREKLHIEIISEGAPGFLGFGAKKAKIRASLMRFDMSLGEVLDDSLSKTVQEAKKPAPRRPAREQREHKKTAPQPQRETTPPAPQAAPQSSPAAPAPPVSPQPSAAVPAPPADVQAITDKAAAVPVGEGDDTAVRAKTLLEGILTRMDLNFPVTVEESEDTISLNIEGDGGGLLIGRRGQNLDAIQYIITKALSKSGNDRKIITVDIEEYRQKRESSLVALAEKLGEKVKKSKKAVTVDHMNARDRRIIHMTLQNDEALVTKSRGEGEYKKIIIMPVKKR
ncbi:MAG: Jag N-terminal domain-containing protein [Deltaproteobacteria bacterium]|nr:Jag N-terminal domain-containing protein [Deltaproteobacteria bacterium]